MERLTEGGDWAVVARGDGLEARARERLDEIGHRQQLLPTDKRDGKPTPKQTVYAKGWWKTGTKQICRSSGEISVWSGRGGETKMRTVEGTPIIEAAFQGGHGRQLRYYLDNQPSGPFRETLDLKIWTDWARRKRGETLLVGAGVYCQEDDRLTTAFTVGGEAKPIRG